MSTVTVWPFTIGVPVLHRVPVLPSSMLAGTSPPPVADADAVQPVRGSTVWSAAGTPVPVGMVVVAGEADVAGGVADVDGVGAGGVGPAVVPVLEAAGVQGEGDVLGLAGVEGDPLEAAQVLRRFAGGGRLADVDLGDLGAGAGAGVGDVEADRDVAGGVRAGRRSGCCRRRWCRTGRTRRGRAGSCSGCRTSGSRRRGPRCTGPGCSGRATGRWCGRGRRPGSAGR